MKLMNYVLSIKLKIPLVTLPYLFALYLCLGMISCKTAKAVRPNIILINADDLGAHHVGVYGQEVIKTPRIDQMATEGALFKHGYSSATTCGPSRVALLLGRHIGNLAGTQRKNGGLCRVYRHQVAFPELLRSSDYHTAMFGKHHNVRQTSDHIPVGDLPSDCGFELSIGTFWAMEAHQYFLDGVTAPEQNYKRHLWKDDNGTVTPYHIDPQRYTHNEYVQLALDYIKEKKEKPFFLYLPFQIPHYEIAVPRPGDSDYHPNDKGLLEQYLNNDGSSIFDEKAYAGSGLFQRRVDQPAATHAAMISRLDRDIGLLLDQIIEENMYDRTIVIFTSDNGRVWTPGGDHFNMNQSVRGGKGSLYEGGLKVPFIVWGGAIKSQVIEKPIVMHDLAPTILDWAEASDTMVTDGISWKYKLQDSQSNHMSKEERHLYWENYHGHGCQAVLLDRKYKVIKSSCDQKDYQIELYDLQSDPVESNDLSTIESYRDIVARAKEIFKLQHQPFTNSGIEF